MAAESAAAALKNYRSSTRVFTAATMMNQHASRSVARLATRCQHKSVISQRYPNARPIQRQQLRNESSGRTTDTTQASGKAVGDIGSNTSTSTSVAPKEQAGNEEAIRATREAIQALKDAKKARTSSETETILKNNASASTGTSKQSSSEGATLWSKLRTVRTPLLFGAGLYLGLAIFGEHRDSKRDSDFLAELKASFEDSDKKR